MSCQFFRRLQRRQELHWRQVPLTAATSRSGPFPAQDNWPLSRDSGGDFSVDNRPARVRTIVLSTRAGLERELLSE